MKKYWVSLSILVLVAAVFGANHMNPATRMPANLENRLVPQGQEISELPATASPIYLPATREDNVVLVDSSLNGYGMLVGETNPLSWDPVNNRFLMAYRQWAGTTASGVIGAALSEDGGQSFFTYSNLNAGVGTQQAGRYPSAIATPNYPMIVWNEYGGGGGSYGGRAYYTYDEGEYGGEIFTPPADLSTSPTTNDIWQGSPCVSYGADGSISINAVYADWTDPRNKYLFRSTTDGAWDGLPLTWQAPLVMVDQAREFLGTSESNYTSNGALDINDDGVGYFVVSGYWNDTLAIANHTLFIKQTVDYGATWTAWQHVPDQVMNAYFRAIFPDSIYSESDGTWTTLGDNWTPFVNYDLDVMVDANGGCHIFAGVLPSSTGGVYPGWDITNGLYHFYSPQNDLFNWDISPVASLQSAWFLDDPGWQGVFPTAARDIDNPDNLYLTYYTWPDTSTALAYFDIMAVYSTDNGATWSAPMNISNTDDPDIDETDPHLARLASNGVAYIMYQMPDYEFPSVNPPASSEDYKNRIYFRTVSYITGINDENSAIPTGYALAQNYPNPFNPTTTLAYNIPVAGQMRLTLFDVLGREVSTLVNGTVSAGRHEIRFDATQLASGMYFYKMDAGSYSAVRKMLLMK